MFVFFIKFDSKNFLILGFEQIVRLLIGKGAQVNATNGDGDSALTLAAKAG